nr:immunoglobulin light chain junction region [Macaca mulatta]MOW44147.1 immunoglobulin light chain junction region [Macaca mulatta]MOW44351.1 immunoglobulin light chain junction region [Macaca mulatta]MOW45292.1 immunoglobulin light chain junction region [Macaca mulatta]
CQQGYIYPYSF